MEEGGEIRLGREGAMKEVIWEKGRGGEEDGEGGEGKAMAKGGDRESRRSGEVEVEVERWG